MSRTSPAMQEKKNELHDDASKAWNNNTLTRRMGQVANKPFTNTKAIDDLESEAAMQTWLFVASGTGWASIPSCSLRPPFHKSLNSQIVETTSHCAHCQPLVVVFPILEQSVPSPSDG